MKLAGGLIGVRQDLDTLSLKPEVGGAVCLAGCLSGPDGPFSRTARQTGAPTVPD
jgi:hypothetical protein